MRGGDMDGSGDRRQMSTAYRRSFATLCAGTIETMLDMAFRRVGEGPARHLDVGCGTGELAVASALRGSDVVAVDPDRYMVAATQESAREAGQGVKVRQAAAPVLPFADGGFDVVTANFVVNHAADPRTTVRDLARVTADGGCVAMTIWPAEAGPHLAAYGEAASAAGAVAVPSTRLAPALDFPRSVEGLAMLAEQAGLHVTHGDEVHWVWNTTADDLMGGIAAGIATPGRIHRAQTQPVRDDIERRVRRRWATHAVGDRLAFPVSAPIVCASRE